MKKSLMMLVLSMLLVSSMGLAETPAGSDVPKLEKMELLDSVTLVEIEKGILYLLRCCPNHAVVRKPGLRMKFVVAFYKAALRAHYDWETLVSVAYAESGFTPDSTGPMGEVGLMQLHTERPWRHCAYKEGREIDRDNLEDQIICGAHWLRFGQDRVCNGTVAQGIAKFMTRGTCTPEEGTALAWKVNHRLKMRQTLGSDKVQVEYHKKRKVNEKRRSEYISKKKAKRQAKLQAKWNARWRAQRKAKRQEKLQAKRQDVKGVDTMTSKTWWPVSSDQQTKLELKEDTKWSSKPRIKPQPERLRREG